MKEFMEDMGRIYGIQMLAIAFFPYSQKELRYSK